MESSKKLELILELIKDFKLFLITIKQDNINPSKLNGILHFIKILPYDVIERYVIDCYSNLTHDEIKDKLIFKLSIQEKYERQLDELIVRFKELVKDL